MVIHIFLWSKDKMMKLKRSTLDATQICKGQKIHLRFLQEVGEAQSREVSARKKEGERWRVIK